MNTLLQLFHKRIEKNKWCCVCKTAVDRFHPYRGGWAEAPPLMSILEITGSDIDNFSCPECAAHDRERHLLLYLERLGLLDQLKGAAILHFAPEKRLSRIIDGLVPLRYVKADLYPVDATIEKVDMLNIPYEAESFDFVFANHVLEHVADDAKALSELRRVLKTGGRAILQTPYSGKLHATFQDPGVDSDEARLQIYGQEDHVRLYGLDIFDRFSAAGFRSEIQTHAGLLSDIDPVKYGVNVHEPLFHFIKQ